MLEEGLKKTRMTTDSLLTNLRKKDVFYVDQVETDGTVSILKKPQFLGVMQKDIMNVQSSRGTAQAFIIDGKILQKSLSLLGKDASWVKNVLLQHNISRISDVFFAQIDQVGNIYIDLRDDLM
ncbi:YetF domain-containing protein [Litchfieldia alkalitelluris]|uniref:YetF domain-containing protein n=1 Tax=Litchfieldia alkalitelluris TaxID=304268 RepID=UPI001F27339C|nr:YetF domain-containing protein [Litchfieldia alkalitelluris]